MNPLNIIGGSRRRPTFCRNEEYKKYLLDILLIWITNNEEWRPKRWFFHYFYFYLKSRSKVDQKDNQTIKSAAHFKKCLRQAADKLRSEMK